jgi:hypothetical protein
MIGLDVAVDVVVAGPSVVVFVYLRLPDPNNGSDLIRDLQIDTCL